MNQNSRTAFIAIVGKPNVGKSSILNILLGQKIAIVSNKPQTTRTRIMGILTEDETQLVFIDTPGLHKPRTGLGDFMVRSVNESVAGVDACLLVTEAGRSISDTEKELIAKFKALGIPAVLAINKIDTLNDKTLLMEQICQYSMLFDFASVVPVSAKDGSGLTALKNELKNLSSPGMHLFESDALTDQPEKTIAAEIIREKILRLTEKEIPHGTAVVIEKMHRREESEITDIDAVIFCEKQTHKGILIGKAGSMLKRIGTNARMDIERFFECKINLTLWVKVKEDWRNRDALLHNFGFDKSDFS